MMSAFLPDDPRLTAYALGELGDAGRADVERLLADDPAAQAELAAIQDTIGLLKTELATEPVLSLTVAQREAIHRHARSTEPSAAPQGVPSVSRVSDTRTSTRGISFVVAGTLAATAAGIALLVPAFNPPGAPRGVALLTEESFESESAVTDVQPAGTALAMADAPVAARGVVQEQLHQEATAFRSLNETAGASAESDKRRERLASGKASDELSDAKSNRDQSVVALKRMAGAVSAPLSDKSGPAESPREELARLVETEKKQLGEKVGKAVEAEVPARTLARPALTSGGAGVGGAAFGNRGGLDPLSSTSLAANSPTPSESDRSKAEPVRRSAAVSSLAKGERQLADRAKLDLAERKSELAADQQASVPTNALGVDPNRARMKAKPASGPTAAAPGAGVPVDALVLREGEKAEAETRRLPLSLDSKLAPESARPAVMSVAPGAEAYEAISENEFATPEQQPLSTFSIDVDSASYANARRFIRQNQLPPPAAVRVEEFINYFRYDYPEPTDGAAFSVTANAIPCPWQKDHYLARIGLKAKHIDKTKRPPTNLVFLVDVSGSMQPDNKLPLVKRGLLLLAEEMGANDRISIVTYAGDAGLKLAPTPGSDQTAIMQAIEALHAGGSTNGAAGINLAYEQAQRNFNAEGENRVILCTDGDFNVGVSSDNELVNLIQDKAKSGVFLSIFGFGMGNLKDSKLEKLADKGNGHYGYIDDLNEARKVFNEELVGTLYTVAKDVKLQVEFNPGRVGAYRLIGYENRALAAEDFNDDTKDAGEIGAGHTVTALYEIVPVGKWPKTPKVDALKYASADKKQPAPAAVAATKDADVDDLFTVKLRYKQPQAKESTRTQDVIVDDIAGRKDITVSRDMLWSASVANFAMKLRNSKHAGQWSLDDLIETLESTRGDDPTGRKAEFIELVKAVKQLKK